MDISKIQTAFFPSQEISNPEFFVGRTNEIKSLILALSEGGSFIAIHGLRGVGKSSIVKQLKLISNGDNRLARKLGIERFVPKKGFDFLTVTVSCDVYTENVSDVIKRIIFGDNDSEGLLSFTSAGDRKVESIKEKFKAGGSAGLFGVKIEGGLETEYSYKATLTDDLIQQFKQLLNSVQKDNLNKSGLLIVIDEFDILKDKNGFASLVKTCSNDYVKFAISGIANTVTELVESHTSIGRQLHPVHIDKMPTDEMIGILKRAEHHVENKITFTDKAAVEITQSSEGFPYFVHLLGKQSFIKAFDTGQSTISESDILQIKGEISKGRLNTIYEEIYHSAVKESPQRELLLKFFAEENSDEIFTESVYSNARELGVSNPSQLMKELTQPQDNSLAVLTKLREQYYRFTDPVFKVYAKLRTWKFQK